MSKTIIRDFIKAIKNDGSTIVSMAHAQVSHAIMSKSVKTAYNAMAASAAINNSTGEITCTIPPGVSQKDAAKALHVIQLEYGKEWKVKV